MGISDDFGIAFAKSQIAAGNSLPTNGNILFSVKDTDKKKAVELADQLQQMGFKIVATKGTCIEFINNNLPSEFVLKMTEGMRKRERGCRTVRLTDRDTVSLSLWNCDLYSRPA